MKVFLFKSSFYFFKISLEIIFAQIAAKEILYHQHNQFISKISQAKNKFL
jgi:hypothetical protein